MLVADHPDVATVAGISREHVEAFKTWLAARPGYRKQNTLSKTTLGMRMGHLRAFFERIAEWDYDDVPARIPVFASDRPFKDRPLPKFLDDPSAAKLMTAARGPCPTGSTVWPWNCWPAPECARASYSD